MRLSGACFETLEGGGCCQAVSRSRMGRSPRRVTWDHLQVAVIITLVGLMESIAVAKALAERNGYELDANQELAGELTLCAASVHSGFGKSTAAALPVAHSRCASHTSATSKMPIRP